MEKTPDEMMYKRMAEYQQRYGELDPYGKSLFFFAYSAGQVDARGDMTVDFADPNVSVFTFKSKPIGDE